MKKVRFWPILVGLGLICISLVIAALSAINIFRLRVEVSLDLATWIVLGIVMFVGLVLILSAAVNAQSQKKSRKLKEMYAELEDIDGFDTTFAKESAAETAEGTDEDEEEVEK